ncbi:MAG: bifunctional serine/threonine-protein kinase/formylglycine-generating enzyme family protein [Sandaracinaceae bacterium]
MSVYVAGATIEGWRLVAPIGKGGMGEVWEAVREGERAAIKLMHVRADRRAERERRLRREVNAVRQIDHPALVPVLEFGVDEERGALYLVMERLDGAPLSRWIGGEGATRLAWTLHVRELCEPLAIAHRRLDASGAPAPIVHRDLKPDNVFIDREGRVRLLDFGIATEGGADTSLTDTGVGLGTAHYMSPEQATDARDVDPRADVWSLGVMLYEALTGRRPFEAPSKNEIISKILTRAPAPIRTLAPEVPVPLAELVERCLEKEPGRRPRDARELADALDAVLDADARETLRASVPVGAARTEAIPDETTRPPAGPRDASPSRAGIAIAIATVGIGTLVAVAIGITTSPNGDRASDARRQHATLPSDASIDATSARETAPEANPFVRVEGAVPDTVLGVGPIEERFSGFRPEARVRAPTEPFELQAHEVTWGELEPWLAAGSRARPSILDDRPSWLPDAASERAALPATGVGWTLARDYCTSLGARLPREEEWEHAARSRDRDATPPSEPSAPRPVEAGAELRDLVGNAREWTAELFRDGADGETPGWADDGGLTYRAVRGVGLGRTTRWDPPPGAPYAHRVPLCASGACPEGTEEFLREVGFRCAR